MGWQGSKEPNSGHKPGNRPLEIPLSDSALRQKLKEDIKVSETLPLIHTRLLTQRFLQDANIMILKSLGLQVRTALRVGLESRV